MSASLIESKNFIHGFQNLRESAAKQGKWTNTDVSKSVDANFGEYDRALCLAALLSKESSLDNLRHEMTIPVSGECQRDRESKLYVQIRKPMPDSAWDSMTELKIESQVPTGGTSGPWEKIQILTSVGKERKDLLMTFEYCSPPFAQESHWTACERRSGRFSFSKKENTLRYELNENSFESGNFQSNAAERVLAGGALDDSQSYQSLTQWDAVSVRREWKLSRQQSIRTSTGNSDSGFYNFDGLRENFRNECFDTPHPRHCFSQPPGQGYTCSEGKQCSGILPIKIDTDADVKWMLENTGFVFDVAHIESTELLPDFIDVKSGK